MSSDESDDAASRRRRLVAKALAARQAASESSSSSSSSSSEDEPVRLKPVFISKTQRGTVDAEYEPASEQDADFLERQREQIKKTALLSDQIEQGIKATEFWSDMQPKAPPIGDEDPDAVEAGNDASASKPAGVFFRT